MAGQPLRVFIVTGEHSGDALGGKLMRALSDKLQGRVVFEGIGGHEMEAAGLVSRFPLSDVAVMGPIAILSRLPSIVRRVYQAVDAAIAFSPDIVVIIDAPEFTHPIAKRIKRKLPAVPVVDYVSPSVWAWRPGRARKMTRYVDHVLALLPFEPAAHARLGGPACTYVGHPMIERAAEFAAADAAKMELARRLGIPEDRPVLVVLPGSRRSEVERLLGTFGDAVAVLKTLGPDPAVIIPAVPHVRGLIEAGIAKWPQRPHIVNGVADKLAAFKLAAAALAASGTVTLELAFAGTPMVVGYKVDIIAAQFKYLIKVPSVVLANLVLGENTFPELLQTECTPERLAVQLEKLLRKRGSRELAAQRAGLVKIPDKLRLPAGQIPSEAAASVVLDVWRGQRSAR